MAAMGTRVFGSIRKKTVLPKKANERQVFHRHEDLDGAAPQHAVAKINYQADFFVLMPLPKHQPKNEPTKANQSCSL